MTTDSTPSGDVSLAVSPELTEAARRVEKGAASARAKAAEQLARSAGLAEPEDRPAICELVVRTAARRGIYSASMDEAYAARARNEYRGFTVPAMNLRALTFDLARAAFRAAMALDASPIVLEIARSEMGYTDQRPSDYAACVFAAALAEGYEGPVFIQGDHFQVNPKAPRGDEVEALRRLVDEAISARFYNIDIDASTVVDLTAPSVEKAQEENGEITARLASHVRRVSPKGVTVSIGGEIGEVGKTNSTESDLRAFLSQFNRAFSSFEPGARGLSKLSVQTGTSHGGIPLPDGTVKKVAVDFSVHERLGELARTQYGLGGTVQHGASTLPVEEFPRFPQVQTLEVHLATQFQNLTFEHLPNDFRVEMYRAVERRFASDRREGETDQQFLYRNRKRILGPYKRELWDLPESVRREIADALETEFRQLFLSLGGSGTRDWSLKYAPPFSENALA